MNELPLKLAEKIEQIPVGSLIPYAKNSRTHSKAQVAQIAASIKEFGFTNPVLVDKEGSIVAGHGRLLAAQSLGLAQVPCIRLDHLSKKQARALVIADNKLAENAGWDDEVLAEELAALEAEGFDLGITGFSEEELDELLDRETKGLTEDDEVPVVQETPVSKLGDVWLLGEHRVMCGDSTSAKDVATLTAGRVAHLLHADPPYGMGKEADGVANDNLYLENLDTFQMEWWRAFRAHLAQNASAYIWGIATDLWRLWYHHLETTETLKLRNEIVWDKKRANGMKDPGHTQFPTVSERCLFFQFGEQFFGRVNVHEFPVEWETIRAYLAGEAKAAGVTQADLKRVCGVSMFSHWFTTAQFAFIPEKHYQALRNAYPEHFGKSWAELKREWDIVNAKFLRERAQRLNEQRSYFDNTHDIMKDVWEFPIVTGEERHGHATPKPVAMMERVMRSSLPEGGLCLEPFGGSGSTLIGAEKTGRVCFSMELQPKYVDVIVRRWEAFTGKKATHAETGEEFPG